MKNIRSKKTLLTVLALAILVLGIFAVITAYYITHFSMTLNGEKDMTVNLNSVFDDPGAKAIINGKNVSDEVEVIGEIDTSSPGIYDLTYKAGHLSVKRSVKVLDEMNPQIILEDSGKAVTVKLGEEYEDPGYHAVDEDGRDITGKVKITGDNFKKAGENKVTYTVSDGKGNITQVSREVTVEPNVHYDSAGLPICMYHYVYDEKKPPDDLNRRYGNYISIKDLSEELEWLNEEGYYYPTWKEVREYIDGKLILPEKSIVLCFDDGAVSFLKNGIPVLEKYKIPATCFMITSKNGEEKVDEYRSDYLVYESHSHNMHRPGGNIGHGGVFTAISEEEGMADLKESIKICGSGEAFAYPFGDYNVSSRDMVEEAGFLCAVTTEYRKARPGTDPLLLPRIRMVMGQSLESFKDKVSP